MRKIVALLFSILAFGTTGFSQELKVTPSTLTLNIGQSQKLTAQIIDENGKTTEGRSFAYYSTKRRALSADSTGLITAHLAGEYSVIVISPGEDGSRLRSTINVLINHPPIARVEIEESPSQIFEGTTIPIKVNVFDELNFLRNDINVSFHTNKPSVVSFDVFGNLTAEGVGKATISAEAEGIKGSVNINVIESPISRIQLSSDAIAARTGDVFHFNTSVLDKKGNVIENAPLHYSFVGVSDNIEYSASGLIKQDGRFVADIPGMYTIMVKSGQFAAQKTVKITPRNVSRKIEVVGHGSVSNKHTSDFWIWEGVDGRDYAVTGTWGADGTAYFWDVTDPSNVYKIDSIKVDARTVNDVKVSKDGTICVISREGASNRKNGIVILDVKDPKNVSVISTFTENLTGGVHNVFIDKGIVYALSAGRKYYMVDINDPLKPHIVGEFELETVGHSIHDVWIENGIAYSSNWTDGIQLVDVGNGIAGGTHQKPVRFASYAYPSGANHASFPFHSPTGKFYVIGGDEKFPYGLDPDGDKPGRAAGFLHFIDFTDLENPEEVASFEIPMMGSHNYWVDGETLYAAFYNGGVRVVDLSGELMGDLYKQGREIAWIVPEDPNGYVKNAPFTWGAQLHKGHVFYSDWNSGLWSAKVAPAKPDPTKVEIK
ncbi:MAG: Ig-like domain-containing protein [Cyclobacteriaceae bacterium]|nr:Ig-like domain-containing protein [Cyclobacteriaceae bacterium]